MVLQSRMLTQLLTHCHLPDLTSIDQLYLIALADTVASVDADLADCFDEMSDDGANETQKNEGPTLGMCRTGMSLGCHR